MKILFTLYLILIHAFIGLTILKTDIVSRLQTALGYEAVKDELTPYFHTMLAFHRRVDKNIPVDSVLFIGDSLTQGLAVSAVFPKSVNFGIGQDTTVGVLTRIPYYSSLSRSKLAVIAIGINDLRRRDNDEIIRNYRKIADLIPSNIPALVNAIFPVDELASRRAGINARIDEINHRLKEICASNPRLHFIDISALIVDANGNLSPDHHIGDGIHLNDTANGIWISQLKESVANITLPSKEP